MSINILYEDKFIIVAIKPPKMPCQKDKTEDLDLLSILKEKIRKEDRVSNPYIGLIHRLDRPVGGVIVYSKTKYANTFISKEIQDRNVTKEYLVIVCGKPEENQGILVDKLFKIASKNMSVVRDIPEAKEAVLEYKLIETIDDEEFGPLSLLKVDLKTGRHHQIRVQLSHHNLPLWGDTKYNEIFTNRKEWSQIALWASTIKFIHPNHKKELFFESLPPNEYPWNSYKYFMECDSFAR